MNYTGTNQGKYAFHFVADKLRDGRPIPKDGEWLKHEGPTSICYYGLHASWRVSDALRYAPGPTLCLVEVSDIDEQQVDKLVCKRRRIVARFDATELLRADARASALACLKHWKDEVPQSVVDWLTIGDEKYRSAARSAAWNAAWNAARSAARSATWSAAWSAAESAAWRAARSAAESAAWSAAESAESAARSAAWSAAWSAIESAAESAPQTRLHNAVMAKFIEMGVLS